MVSGNLTVFYALLRLKRASFDFCRTISYSTIVVSFWNVSQEEEQQHEQQQQLLNLKTAMLVVKIPLIKLFVVGRKTT